jgi:uncharacterized repeat protein (TIGR01451 family)
MKNYLLVLAVLILLLSTNAYSGGSTLYAVSPYSGDSTNDGGLMIIDPATGLVLSAIDITYNGIIIDGSNGLAIDPLTQIAYTIIKTTNRSPSMTRTHKRGQNRGGGTPTRGLATIDLATGVTTLIADLGDNFAGITFDCSGQLYGVTGDGATVSETAYRINKATAATTLLATLGDGSDGETIGYNTNDGLLYTRSGRDTDSAFTSIDPSNGTVVAIGGTTLDEAFSMLWDSDTTQFIEANLDNELVSLQTDGTHAIIATGFVPYYKGLAWVPTKGCGAPDVSATKIVVLQNDADASGTVTEGDTLRYTITTTNVGTSSTVNALINDTPDGNTTLVVGSVTSTQGSITTGNTGGDTTVTVDVGSIVSPAGAVTVTFDVIVNALIPGVNTTISNQGTISGDNFANVLTDDPSVAGASDSTDIVAIGANLTLDATMIVALTNDADGTSSATSGDTLSYTIVVTNNEVTDALNVMIANTPDSKTTLETGTVVSSMGSVTTGNTVGDTDVLVSVPTLSNGGGTVSITFDVVVNELPFGSSFDISSQASITGSNVDTVLTDDPTESGVSDPTVISGHFIAYVPLFNKYSLVLLTALILIIGFFGYRRKSKSV